MMIRNIQALRALAAILVVFYHAVPHYVFMGGGSAFLIAVGKLGFTGVDVFFVISGFVIALTTSDKPRNFTSAANFIKNRSARIYLGYWPFLFLMFTLRLKYQPALLENATLFDNLFLFPPGIKYVLPVAWSLTFELYFYILFIFFFWVPKKYLPVSMLVLFVLILLRTIFISLEQQLILNFFASHYLLEFFSGALLYHYQDALVKKRYILVPIVILIVGVSVGLHFNYEVGRARVYSFGSAAFSLLWLFLIIEKEGIYKANQTWSELGDASYTLYLSHTVLLTMLFVSGLREWLSLQHPLFMLASFVLIVSGIIVFSLQFYNTIEAPLYERVRKLIIYRQTKHQ